MDQEAIVRDLVRWASDHPNIRLVVVTGSVARHDADALSDVDVELYVTDPSDLLDHDEWYRTFGDVLVVEELDNPGWHPTRLVYYVDGKIDFMIGPTSAALSTTYVGPFRTVVDKDGIAAHLMSGVTQPPDEAEFRRCVNWFYAAAIMCARNLARDDPWPAKMRGSELNGELLTMIEWAHKGRHGWDAAVGHNGAGIMRWADDDIARELAWCWADYSPERTSAGLEVAKRLFDRLSGEVAAARGFDASQVRPASTEVDRLLAIR